MCFNTLLRKTSDAFTEIPALDSQWTNFGPKIKE
jgi:hypothetical protein